MSIATKEKKLAFYAGPAVMENVKLELYRNT
jgi:hypothetical protein